MLRGAGVGWFISFLLTSLASLLDRGCQEEVRVFPVFFVHIFVSVAAFLQQTPLSHWGFARLVQVLLRHRQQAQQCTSSSEPRSQSGSSFSSSSPSWPGLEGPMLDRKSARHFEVDAMPLTAYPPQQKHSNASSERIWAPREGTEPLEEREIGCDSLPGH